MCLGDVDKERVVCEMTGVSIVQNLHDHTADRCPAARRATQSTKNFRANEPLRCYTRALSMGPHSHFAVFFKSIRKNCL